MGLFGNKGKDPEPGEQRELAFAPGELASSLRPFVMPPDRLPPGVAEGAPLALPGLVMGTALLAGGRLDFVPVSSMSELGGAEAVWGRAMRNVENLHGLRVVREACDAAREDTELVTLSGDDPFVASRVAVLDWLVSQVHGSPSRYGVMVAVPSWHRLILHVVSGMGVLTAVETMALAAGHWFRAEEGNQSVSPDVYYVAHDRRAQRVAYPDVSGKVTINTTGLMGEMLFGPAPHGLGLEG
ncbi:MULTISPECIES: hypothetical protein [unclassified Streptomyces]|uniref:hypothetical protein n=1 Tax=unclassified Streptomyces TaxID=2593676 RepID=UPI0012FED4CC|nr:hypothetical protein [Streptomyces sp. NBC_00370]